jgi:hypothetical protein
MHDLTNTTVAPSLAQTILVGTVPAMVVYLGDGSPAAAIIRRVAALSRAMSHADGGLPAGHDTYKTTPTYGSWSNHAALCSYSLPG